MRSIGRRQAAGIIISGRNGRFAGAHFSDAAWIQLRQKISNYTNVKYNKMSILIIK
jgi:hypothetical protein